MVFRNAAWRPKGTLSTLRSRPPSRPLSCTYASFASLPLDVLRLIFRLIPVHPRVRVISLVCKRWRTLVLSSVTRARRFSPAVRWFRLFPALEHLDITTRAMASRPLPLSLRSLAFYAEPDYDHLPHLLALTALTAVSLHTRWRSAQRLLLHIRTSLTSLHILTDDLGKPRVARGIAELFYPRLTDLSIPYSVALAPLLERHASSLTRLSVKDSDNFATVVRFPRVTYLHLAPGWSSNAQVGPATLAQFPALQDLSLGRGPPPPEARPFLVAIVATPRAETITFTRLHTLRTWLPDDPQWAHVPTSLRSLSVGYSPQLTAHLERFPRLKRLNIRHE